MPVNEDPKRIDIAAEYLSDELGISLLAHT
jgi:hypothetical protein